MVIEVTGLSKHYGDLAAVDDVSFSVEREETFGIVGPNGAGKTTTVETIIGLTKPTSGSVRILGMDPARDGQQIRQRVGVQLQSAALPTRIKVWEAVELFSSFYEKTADGDALLEQWGLADKRSSTFQDLSGGQQQRLFIVLALLNQPELVIFDELTTGLDPQARRATWDLIRRVREAGTTVVLVSHYMDEVEALCDRVAVFHKGRIVALDSPANLRGPRKAVRFTAGADFSPAILTEVEGVTSVEHNGSEVIVSGEGALLSRVAAALAQHGIEPEDLRTDDTSLEDVFVKLTT